MGLIIQIVLTIVAWNRGWRWLALIPMGAALFLGFMIGLIGGGMGYTAEDMSWTIVFDIITLIVLIILCVKQPESAQLPQSNSTNLPQDDSAKLPENK